MEDDAIVFSLTPPDTAKVPRVISYQPAVGNSSYYEGGEVDTALVANLSVDEESTLKLNYRLVGDAVIEGLRLRYILPPKYDYIPPEPLPAVAGTTEVVFEKPITVVESGEFLLGSPFLLCQIDYLADGRPERVFASFFEPRVIQAMTDGYRDNSYVSSIFTDRSIWENALPLSVVGAELPSDLEWYAADETERSVFHENVVDVGERLRGELKAKPEGERYYMIVSDLVADRDGVLRERHVGKTSVLYLNGERLEPKSGDPLLMKKGLNRLVILGKANHLTNRIHRQFNYTVRRQ